MPTHPPELVALATLVLAAAVLYSMVGHAGATAYLAAMALFGVTPAAMKPAALVMNVVVATVGAARFVRAGLVPWPLVGPLCAGSVPAAFVGGAIDLPRTLYQPLLGASLLLAALRLWAPGLPARQRPLPRTPWLVGIGAGLGLLAGLTGIGGGVFLSPLVILAGVAEPRRTAGAAVVFILVNSLAGLLGHLAVARGIPPGTGLLSLVALTGGLCGSWLGVHRLPALALRRVLAVVLVIGGVKLLAGAG